MNTMPSPPGNDRTLLQPMSHALDGTHLDSHSPAQRIALIRVEQRREWQVGRRVLAEAYLARQKSRGREVALKMVLSGEFAGPNELERFRTEAVQLAKLQHPNIVQIYEVGECEGRPYFAMEFVPGGSLARLLERKPLAAR